MYVLSITVLGSALATIGAFLLVSCMRIPQRAHRRYSGEVAGVLMLLGGGWLLYAAIAAEEVDAGDPTAFDPNSLLEAAPAAAGLPHDSTRALASLPFSSIKILSWGTPSDRDRSDAIAVQDFSRNLRYLTKGILLRNRPTAQVATLPMTRAQYAALRDDPQKLVDQCEPGDGDLVLAIGVGATRFNGGYALWREPLYVAADCRTGMVSHRIGRVTERPGDRFPYELGVRTEVVAMLGDLANVDGN